MEIGVLKGPDVKWVWNTRFIRGSEYLDIRKTACNVLKDLVTGPFVYMVRDVAPANFEQKLRQLVVGHVQNTTQQAHKLTCEITGCKKKIRVWVFDLGRIPSSGTRTSSQPS
jgi:hypothetical protein